MNAKKTKPEEKEKREADSPRKKVDLDDTYVGGSIDPKPDGDPRRRGKDKDRSGD